MYNISHLNHTIPDVSISAISGSKIYYCYNTSLYLYRIGDTTPTNICEVGNAQHIFFINSTLFVLAGNVLQQYKQTECSAILKNTTHLSSVPLKVSVFSSGAVFLYERSIEIFRNILHKAETGPHKIIDICSVGDTSYVLTRNGEVYACLNVVESCRIIYKKRLLVVHDNDLKKYTSINSVNDFIVLSNGEGIAKYRINNNCMVLEYELIYSGKVINNLLCGENAVELEAAPFICLVDRLYSFNGSIGVSSSRIYSFERVESSDRNEEVEYSGWRVEPGSINVGRVVVPKIVDDNELKGMYIKLVETIEEYNALCNSIEPIIKGLMAREAEVEELDRIMRGAVDEHKEEITKLRERVEKLEKRAGMVVREEGDFKENIEKLQCLIDKINKKDFGKYKHRLMAQRMALKSKINS